MITPQKLAAIDLGSNSFHLIIATLDDKGLKPLDRIKEMVRLASGLDEKNRISHEKIDEATACLKQFGQLIKDFPPSNVKCVGTNTLRKAQNSIEFLEQAEKALGFSINIIGGREEARLVYEGVARSIAQTEHHRLVIDIGGGSTEFIIGQADKPILMESLNMGCVNFTLRYFKKGIITKKNTRKAILAARQKLEWISDEYIENGWQETIGSSGTIKSIAEILDRNFQQQGVITYKYLKKLRNILIDIRDINKIEIDGLSSNRAPIIIGGVCVLIGAFEELDIESMTTSSGALREGLLYGMLDCASGQDIRFASVKNMADRYHVDKHQAQIIRNIADIFLDQLNLKNDKDVVDLVNWSIDLHEIGLTISHVNTAQHSAYIVEQSDMPGFSRELQNTIGLLLRLYRGKIKRSLMEDLARNPKQFTLILLVLRLSIMLARGRRDKKILKNMVINKYGKSIELVFPEGFLKNHPLTEVDLEQEQAELRKISYNLKYRDADVFIENE